MHVLCHLKIVSVMHQIIVIKKIMMDHLGSSKVHFSQFQRWPPYFNVLSDNGHNYKQEAQGP